MNITVIEEFNLQQWDGYLNMFSAGPFITSSWLEAFRTSYRSPIYFRLVDKENTVGLAAGLILEPSQHILRKFDRAIFFFSGPAVLRSDQELIRTCTISLINYAAANGYTSVQFKSWDYPYEYDLGDFPFHKKTRPEYIIDLRGELSDIQKNIKKKTKERIRKAKRSGLIFYESHSPAIIEELLGLLNETKSIRLLKGHTDYSYFYMPYFDKELIYKLFQNKIARIFYVKREDKILCIQLRIIYAKRAFALLAATGQEGYKLGANHFAMFHQIEQFKQEGIETFNLGGIPKDSGELGLITYKTAFGAEKHTCVGGITPFLQGPFIHVLARSLFKIRGWSYSFPVE